MAQTVGHKPGVDAKGMNNKLQRDWVVCCEAMEIL
jgi:hypothetical protein